MEKNILSNYWILLTFVGSLLFFNSCQDFLTETNPNQQTKESFWKTLDDADQGLNAVYNRFKDQNIYDFGFNNWSDLTFPGYGQRVVTTNEFYQGLINNSVPKVATHWSALYSGIFRANQVLEGMKTVKYTNIPANVSRANNILGQAYFFRGLFYFYLYNTFNKGSVPIKDVTNMYDMYTKLSPDSVVRKFYLNDLDSAYAKLPNNWRTSTTDKGRPTKGTVATILGQSYLYEKNYATAATYFLDVINNSNYGNTDGYHLAANIGDNFNVAGELNDESILEICYSMKYLQDQKGGADGGVSSSLAGSLAPNPLGGFRQIIPACWLEFAYREDVIDKSDARNKYPNGNLHAYSLRLSKSIACTQDTSSITYGQKQYIAFNYNSKETSYFKKFTNCETPGVILEDKLLSQSSINFRVLRLADVYLMYAECMIKGGADNAGVDEALKYVNRVRQRSALRLLGTNGSGEFSVADHDNITYTAQTLMDFIKWKERPMELCIEGFNVRHIDLRRWGAVKDRFTLLTKQPYYFQNFSYTDPITKKTVTRLNATLIKVYPPLVPAAAITEFAQVALNYTTQNYDYLPIPSGEETANPDLYK